MSQKAIEIALYLCKQRLKSNQIKQERQKRDANPKDFKVAEERREPVRCIPIHPSMCL